MQNRELTINSPRSWLKLLSSVAVVFALFQLLGAVLGSDRGQAGLLIGTIIVAVSVAAEIMVFRASAKSAIIRLGLGFPASKGILVSIVHCVTLLSVFPIFAWATGAELAFYDSWSWLLPGLFAQAGIAEETLFRGFLFRHVRKGRTFLRASVLSAIPFAVVHLFMFIILPWPVATAGLLLSIAITFPLAYLFELGGDTIWAPATLHFLVQGAIKVITVSDNGSSSFPLVWMAACVILPFLVFLVPSARHND